MQPRKTRTKDLRCTPYPWRCILISVRWQYIGVPNPYPIKWRCAALEMERFPGKMGNLPSLPLLSNMSPSLTLRHSLHNRTRTKDLGCNPRIYGYVFAARIAGKVV